MSLFITEYFLPDNLEKQLSLQLQKKIFYDNIIHNIRFITSSDLAIFFPVNPVDPGYILRFSFSV